MSAYPPAPARLDRRRFLSLAASLGGASLLASCAATRIGPAGRELTMRPSYAPPSDYALMYGPVVDEGYAIPGVPIEQVDPQYYRQLVADPFGEQPGTVVVDTRSHFLYLTQQGGQAMRYGVGLGREGFAWSGRAVVQWKRKWPTWTPPDEMVARQPELARYAIGTGGMPPGIDNPLGARALYIFQNGEDTLYRLHGSPEWFSIGKNVSSGCVRLMNQDIIDLYDRVPNQSPILVI